MTNDVRSQSTSVSETIVTYSNMHCSVDQAVRCCSVYCAATSTCCERHADTRENSISTYLAFCRRPADFTDSSYGGSELAQPEPVAVAIEASGSPLRPSPEQKRIAAILKDQLAAVERARAAAEAQLEAAQSPRLPRTCARSSTSREMRPI